MPTGQIEKTLLWGPSSLHMEKWFPEMTCAFFLLGVMLAGRALLLSAICEQFCANLRRIRRKREFTQEELAHRVGMDVSYLSELENGRKEPCLRKMKEISQALDVPLAQLVRGI